MSSVPPLTPALGFEHRYGLVITELGDGVANGRVEVRDELKQPAGLIHGGVYAAIAESLADHRGNDPRRGARPPSGPDDMGVGGRDL
jgi:acyl-coenzyme A thioesterase PaaI-like protein